jgi:hypothetical protein
MQPGSLAEIVDTLTPEQQAAVREFIDFLKTGTALRENRFSAAVSEFLDEHPDLLRRLAQ